MYFSLRLGSDFDIRIQRKLCSDTASFFFCFAKPNKKAVCYSPLEVELAVLILASRLKVITSFSGHPSGYCGFRLRSALYTYLKYAIKPIVWVATQTKVAISQRVRK